MQKKKLSEGLSSFFHAHNTGRAVDIFFGENPVDDTARYAEIAVNDIVPNHSQPRHVFTPEPMEELVQSIKAVGQLQPIVVRALKSTRGKYEIIMGERRFRAMKLAGKRAIAAIIRETDDQNMLRDALLENLHRSNLNPIEEAAAYEQLLKDFKVSQEELAKKLSRSRPHIANTLRLLKLPTSIQQYLQESSLTPGHARALMALKKTQDLEKIAHKVVASGMSVRTLEAKVKELNEEGLAKPVVERLHRVSSLSQKLTKHLKLPVKVSQKGTAGKIVVEYKNQEELDRLLGLFT